MAQPEHELQFRVKKWCAQSIRCRHKLFCFDRSKNEYKSDSGSGLGKHYWEKRRGVVKGTLDTALPWEGGTLWVELKWSTNTPDDNQVVVMNDLNAISPLHRARAAWSVQQYAMHCKDANIPLYGLAMELAYTLDAQLIAEFGPLGKLKIPGKAQLARIAKLNDPMPF